MPLDPKLTLTLGALALLCAMLWWLADRAAAKRALKLRRSLSAPRHLVVCDPASEAGASRTPAASPHIPGLSPTVISAASVLF